MNMHYLPQFTTESNAIEGMIAPSNHQFAAYREFLTEAVTIKSVLAFQAVISPNTPLRHRTGMNVSVGDHIAPLGGAALTKAFLTLLDDLPDTDPFVFHRHFLTMHPFLDGNGRTARAIWFHMMNGECPLGFLQTFYYQTLENGDTL